MTLWTISRRAIISQMPHKHHNNKKERASRQLNIFMVISTGGGRGGKRGAKGDGPNFLRLEVGPLAFR
jgi:hypothetical protein